MALPAYADFMIIFGICLIFYALLRILTSISNKWKEMMMRRIAVALAKRKAIKDDLSLIQRRAIQLPSFIIIY